MQQTLLIAYSTETQTFSSMKSPALLYGCTLQEKGTGDGLRLTKLEVARVLRERNEYKEKYLSLLEQVRYIPSACVLSCGCSHLYI